MDISWTQKSEGNYAAQANNDTITATATTFAANNERGESCYGLTVRVTASGVSTDYTAPGTFFLAADWGALAEMFLSRALAGKTGTDIFNDSDIPY